jgi:hypothetical protein
LKQTGHAKSHDLAKFSDPYKVADQIRIGLGQRNGMNCSLEEYFGLNVISGSTRNIGSSAQPLDKNVMSVDPPWAIERSDERRLN